MPVVITQEQVFAALPARDPESHKGTYGKVLAVCGCARYRGAAALCCMGALRAGAGLVTLAAEAAVIDSIAGRILEATFLPLPAGGPQAELLAGAAARASACALGCGREEDDATAAAMRAVLRGARGTLVLDAGGLCSLAAQPEALRACAGRLVLTPHPGEMAKLLGAPAAQIVSDPARAALTAAQRFGAVVVLKGHRTLVAAPDGTLYENRTGNAGLARGGSGDVLTGIIAALAAQGLSPLDAAACGVWLHGAAADRCAAARSQQGMLPEDLTEGLCAVFLENGR